MSAQPTRYYVNSADLNTFFAPGSGGELTGFDVSGSDLCSIFAPFAGTSYAAPTYYYSNDEDLNKRFALLLPPTTYTITSGLAPSVKTDGSTYTSLTFSNNTTIQFSTDTTLFNSGSNYTFMIDGTATPPAYNATNPYDGGDGADCLVLTTDKTYSIPATPSYTAIVIGNQGNSSSLTNVPSKITITTPTTTTSILTTSYPSTSFTVYNGGAGGTGYDTFSVAYGGGGGGSAGPTGHGVSGDPGTASGNGDGGTQGSSVCGVAGMPGYTSGGASFGGIGGAAAYASPLTNVNDIQYGSIGIVVLTLQGVWTLSS
jgi:hypothetical protein